MTEQQGIVGLLLAAIVALGGVVGKLYLRGQQSDDQRLAAAEKQFQERLAEQAAQCAKRAEDLTRYYEARIAEKDTLISAWQRVAVGATGGLEDSALVTEAALSEAKKGRR